MTAPAAYRVALVVIARDEAARIARLLDSVRPHVDEMLVLDTGSTDATAQLAAAHGARVGHFRWCDDFSAARNAALDLAGADWHVVLDADEWLAGGGEQLQALRHQAPDFAGSVALQDHFDGGQAQARLTRVLPGMVRYSGRIHEQPRHGLPLRALDIQVGHDGYLPQALQAKRGRNAALLRQALADHPDDAYLWYQLGKDAFVYEDHAQADSAWERAAQLLSTAVLPAWWPDLVARRLFALKQLKQHARGMDFAEGQLRPCADSPDFFFALGDLLLDLAADQPEQGGALLPLIEDSWRRCLELGERPDQPGAVAGRGSHLAAHNLALVLDGTDRPDDAAALRQAWPWPAT